MVPFLYDLELQLRINGWLKGPMTRMYCFRCDEKKTAEDFEWRRNIPLYFCLECSRKYKKVEP